MSIKISGLAVTRKNMDDLARQTFGSQVPSGFVMSDSGIDFVFGAKTTDFIINLLPSINNSQIKNLISGKNVGDIKTILSQKILGINDVAVKLTPSLPFFPFLPHVPDNISVTIEPAQTK